MTKTHLYILNAVGFLLVALVLTNLWLVLGSQTLSAQFIQAQAAINNSRRAEQVLSQLSMRIARDSDKDPSLRALLRKHNLKVTLEVDGKKKDYP